MPLVVYSSRELTEAEMRTLRLGPTQFLNKAQVQPKEVEELVLTMVQRLRSAAAARLRERHEKLSTRQCAIS